MSADRAHRIPSEHDPPFGDLPETLTLRDRQRRSSLVREAIGQLPTQQRDVVTSVYFGGHTQSEVAAEFDLPLSTVRRQLFQGLRQLGGMLDDDTPTRR
jgi:RNA polymerase sigma factor (sigma-70 family)